MKMYTLVENRKEWLLLTYLFPLKKMPSCQDVSFGCQVTNPRLCTVDNRWSTVPLLLREGDEEPTDDNEEVSYV